MISDISSKQTEHVSYNEARNICPQYEHAGLEVSMKRKVIDMQHPHQEQKVVKKAKYHLCHYR